MSCIEPHFYKFLKETDYKIERTSAVNLLTANRFDLAFKLLYLDGKTNGVEYLKEVYDDHIRAFSFGSFTEPGNMEKNSKESFRKAYDEIYENIKKNGFNPTKSIIPLTSSRSIVNGAHRLASCIHLNIDVNYVDISIDEQCYNYKFFYSRNVPQIMLDIAARKFIEISNNTYIACVWPSANGKDSDLERTIPNIVYRKDVQLNANGAHNLLSQVYSGEEWLGSIENNFKGIKGKLVECFKNFNAVRFVAFQASNLDEVLVIKENIRKLFNIGKHSIHITDTKEEAIELASLVFSDNGIHFLNSGKVNKYIDTHNKITYFKKYIRKNNVNLSDVILDSSMTLALYGLRKAKDIDYLSIKKIQESRCYPNIENHDSELVYHNVKKVDLVFNPNYFFIFNGVKFVSFNQVFNMKKTRGEMKDLNDINIMVSVIENNVFKEKVAKYKQRYFYTTLKIKKTLIKIMKKVHIYTFIYFIYKIIKK
ncbi:hypothetical protein GNP80_07295 [Aliivibrio fischeri]|nr:hypothetical protein [Aliivibrio fischeri]